MPFSGIDFLYFFNVRIPERKADFTAFLTVLLLIFDAVLSSDLSLAIASQMLDGIQ